MSVDDLVQQAYVNNPQIEQAVLSMKNNEITIKAEKNGLAAGGGCVCVLRCECAGGAQNPNR
jgi:outer membrane protein